jgi:hypothetical protein
MISILTKRPSRIRSVSFAIAVSIAIGLVARPSHTQQNTAAQCSIFVSVEDEMGKPVAGLTAKNFRASLGRAPATVTNAEQNPPRRILILFDLSTSMHTTFVVKSASLIAVNLIQRSEPDVEFGFSTFGNKFEMQQGFTSNHQGLAQRMIQDLQNAPRRGPSAVYDSAVAATAVFKSPRIGDAVLMFTDGDDNLSVLSSVEAKAQIAASRVRLFTVSPTSDASVGKFTPESNGNRNRLIDMVEGAGGEIFYFGPEYPSKTAHPKRIEFRVEKDYRNTADVADGILRNLATGYRLHVSPTAVLTKQEEWRLEITDGSGAKNPAVFARYQQKLFPCSVPATQQ